MLILIPLYLLLCTAIGALVGSAMAGLIVGATPLVVGGGLLLSAAIYDEISIGIRRRARVKRARERQGLPAKPSKRRP